MQPWERDVRDRDGRWWLLRVLPFRTGDDRIDGATLVAVDIDLVRQSHELKEARDAALAIVQAVREPLVILDTECRVGLANDAFYALLGDDAEQIEGQQIWNTGHGIWTGADVRRLLKEACLGKKSIVNFQMERSVQGRPRVPRPEYQGDRANGSPISRSFGRGRCDRRAAGGSAPDRRGNPALAGQAEGRVPRHPGT